MSPTALKALEVIRDRASEGNGRWLVSSVELSRHLGVSRRTWWRVLDELRSAGAVIVESPAGARHMVLTCARPVPEVRQTCAKSAPPVPDMCHGGDKGGAVRSSSSFVVNNENDNDNNERTNVDVETAGARDLCQPVPATCATCASVGSVLDRLVAVVDRAVALVAEQSGLVKQLVARLDAVSVPMKIPTESPERAEPSAGRVVEPPAVAGTPATGRGSTVWDDPEDLATLDRFAELCVARGVSEMTIDAERAKLRRQPPHHVRYAVNAAIDRQPDKPPAYVASVLRSPDLPVLVPNWRVLDEEREKAKARQPVEPPPKPRVPTFEEQAKAEILAAVRADPWVIEKKRRDMERQQA